MPKVADGDNGILFHEFLSRQSRENDKRSFNESRHNDVVVSCPTQQLIEMWSCNCDFTFSIESLPAADCTRIWFANAVDVFESQWMSILLLLFVSLPLVQYIPLSLRLLLFLDNDERIEGEQPIPKAPSNTHATLSSPQSHKLHFNHSKFLFEL